MNAVRCSNCPNPANCSPTFCAFNDADLPSMKVHMFEQQPAAQMPPSLVRAANERIRRLEAGRAHLLTLADAPGNTLDDFAKWWGNLSMFAQVFWVCLSVIACCFVAGVLVGFSK